MFRVFNMQAQSRSNKSNRSCLQDVLDAYEGCKECEHMVYLLSQMLDENPHTRLTASQILAHDFFTVL